VPVLVCESLIGWRVIAEPPALDSAPWPTGAHAVRISPDDVFLIGATAPSVPADPHAIITPEHGFSGAVLTATQTSELAVHHIEWHLPHDRPALAQGQIAGVPAKLVLHADGSALLLVATAARHELEDRVNGAGS
jgi:hypothetical protein